MRLLYEKAGISTILVAGSSGAFFSQADTIIQMNQYEPKDVTEKVRAIVPFQKQEKSPTVSVSPKEERRYPRPGSDFREERGRVKHKCLGTDGFLIGHGETDLRLVEQLADKEQSECLARTDTGRPICGSSSSWRTKSKASASQGHFCGWRRAE